ncbi:hypothetical protein JCM19239_6053 [Vibrio variabilis]|uniref:Uncharacterized protein n=1 Tax=Vibrio variabilis TaxID=990271 RepID=A0ABQ0JN25_9VIBR|nr:hypothetical protein JCM19239_6053 [Vibrio variabilis]
MTEHRKRINTKEALSDIEREYYAMLSLIETQCDGFEAGGKRQRLKQCRDKRTAFAFSA